MKLFGEYHLGGSTLSGRPRDISAIWNELFNSWRNIFAILKPYIALHEPSLSANYVPRRLVAVLTLL